MRILETNWPEVRQVGIGDASFFFRLLNSFNWLEPISDRGVQSEKGVLRYKTIKPPKSETQFLLYSDN